METQDARGSLPESVQEDIGQQIWPAWLQISTCLAPSTTHGGKDRFFPSESEVGRAGGNWPCHWERGLGLVMGTVPGLGWGWGYPSFLILEDRQ